MSGHFESMLQEKGAFEAPLEASMTITSAWRIPFALLIALAFVAPAYAEDDPDAEVIKKLNALGIEVKREKKGKVDVGNLRGDQLNAEVISLVRQLKSQTSLCICRRKLTKEDGELLDGCENVEDLFLLGCDFDAEPPFAFKNKKRVKSLAVGLPKSLTDDRLKSFSGLTSLESLHLSDAKITGEGLRHLASSPLKSITLRGCDLSAEGIKTLSGFKSLKMVSLRDFSFGDEAAETLSEMKTLRGIFLTNTTLTDKGLSKLIRPSLLWIDVADTKVTDGFIEELKVICPDVNVTK